MRVLPSPFIQIDHTAHRFTFGSSSRKREHRAGVDCSDEQVVRLREQVVHD
jgi:hypothetical protein